MKQNTIRKLNNLSLLKIIFFKQIYKPKNIIGENQINPNSGPNNKSNKFFKLLNMNKNRFDSLAIKFDNVPDVLYVNSGLIVTTPKIR